jgi:hypothetical protein
MKDKKKTPSSASRRGHGAYGRELSRQRQLDDAVMRFQGEDLEAGRYAEEMMGGGMVKGYEMGGEVGRCRGGGAALRGTKFRGVK